MLSGLINVRLLTHFGMSHSLLLIYWVERHIEPYAEITGAAASLIASPYSRVSV